ncbi:MAG TPA: proprotein convertase P-domain-containing protein [Phycisphaerae bacterium]|nr:proprotein convertase P-domain-containing protein [Phycisphaerae bacterium]
MLSDLEPRVLLSAAVAGRHIVLPTRHSSAGTPVLAHITAERDGLQPAATSPPGSAITPSQIRHAFGLDQVMFGNVVGDGSGQTIAIIDAYHYPTALFDLQQFDAAMGLPDLQAWDANGNSGAWFRVVSQTGGTNYPATDPAGAGASAGTWEMEEALDIQWAHAIAPGANIILVEANSNSNTNLMNAAIGWARTQPGVSAISMSFSEGEFSGESSLDSLFTTPAGHTGITFFAATGDNGQPSGYPAFSPNVVAVGGTSLTVSGQNYVAESGWSGSGGSLSTIYTQPSYQSGVVTQSATARANPDIAWLADPNTGVPIYDSYDYAASPWQQFGGTSLATPMWAGLMAVINQGRVLNGLSPLDGRTETLPKLYALPASDFHDITTGNNGFAAGIGFDLVTGRGTPVANLLVADMILPPTGAPGAVDLLAQSDTGISNTDNITFLNNSSPAKTLSFSVSNTIDGATVSLYADGNLIGTALAAGATTTLTTNGAYALASGAHSITATQTQPGLGQSASSPLLSLTIDTTAPAVTSTTPSGTAAGAQTDLKVTFAEAIDTSTFDLSDITSFTGAAGQDLRPAITGFSWSAGNTVLDLQFASQSAVGSYSLTLGPALLDLAGNAMAAPYTASFTIVAAIYAANMDTTPGWTFTSGSAWAWGQPLGGGSHNLDPSSGHTGTNVIGYNLSGDYARNVSATTATTPSIDLTSYQNVTLTFWRWLGVRSTATASVQASSDGGATWTTLWTNNGATVSDAGWVQQSFSLPSSFTGKSNVQFRWTMGPTGTSQSTYPGWNIDDVLVTGSPYVPSSVSGQVFVDANGNGALDAGEAGIPNASVFLDLNNNGVRDAGGTTTVSSSTPVDIPDLGTAISSLNVSNISGVISNLTITFNITHSFDSDIVGTLIAPDNTQITLFSHIGSSGDNFTNTTVSDAAASAITNGSAPFTGTFRPSPGILSTFNGKSPNGTWQFRVDDTVSVDSGVLNGWSLSFTTPSEPLATTDANGTYAFNVQAGTYTVREIQPAGYIPVAGLSRTLPVSAAVGGQNFANFPTTFTPADGGSFYLSFDPSGTNVQISATSFPSPKPAWQIAAALLPSLTFNLSASNQQLFVDFSNGTPPALSINLNSTRGNHAQLAIIGAGDSQTLALTDLQLTAPGGTTLTFTGLDTLDLKNANINFSGDLSTLGNLIIDTGAFMIWS